MFQQVAQIAFEYVYTPLHSQTRLALCQADPRSIQVAQGRDRTSAQQRLCQFVQVHSLFKDVNSDSTLLFAVLTFWHEAILENKFTCITASHTKLV